MSSGPRLSWPGEGLPGKRPRRTRWPARPPPGGRSASARPASSPESPRHLGPPTLPHVLPAAGLTVLSAFTRIRRSWGRIGRSADSGFAMISRPRGRMVPGHIAPPWSRSSPVHGCHISCGSRLVHGGLGLQGLLPERDVLCGTPALGVRPGPLSQPPSTPAEEGPEAGTWGSGGHAEQGAVPMVEATHRASRSPRQRLSPRPAGPQWRCAWSVSCSPRCVRVPRRAHLKKGAERLPI